MATLTWWLRYHKGRYFVKIWTSISNRPFMTQKVHRRRRIRHIRRRRTERFNLKTKTIRHAGFPAGSPASTSHAQRGIASKFQWVSALFSWFDRMMRTCTERLFSRGMRWVYVHFLRVDTVFDTQVEPTRGERMNFVSKGGIASTYYCMCIQYEDLIS